MKNIIKQICITSILGSSLLFIGTSFAITNEEKQQFKREYDSCRSMCTDPMTKPTSSQHCFAGCQQNYQYKTKTATEPLAADSKKTEKAE